MRKMTRDEDGQGRFKPGNGRKRHHSLALTLAFALTLGWAHAQGVERSGREVVDEICAACHETGAEGAPKIGDRDAWVQRLKGGLGILVHSAIRGHGGMPPRGGEANLTDSEMRSAILYMFNPAGAPVKASSGAAQPDPDADTDPLHKSVGGLEIYLGFMPAQMLYALPQGSPERTMHGGIPKGSGYYHVNVSLYDAKRQAPIDDAQVRIQLKEPGLSMTTTELERMPIGSGSYGNYTKPQPGIRYVITLLIERPGATQIVEAKFNHRFE